MNRPTPRPDDPLVHDLLTRCTFPAPGTPCAVACSGGPDSTALVALAVAAGLTPVVHHVRHGIRPDDHLDAGIAADHADRFGLAFEVHEVHVPPGPNLEARARDARRAVLPPDAMTGHTADDQAETVLLRLLRGTGTAGLASMERGKRHPLLSLRRRETVTLCAALGLATAIDPSNRSERHRRNRVRSEVLPLLDDVAGRDVVPLLVRLADLARDDEHLLASLASTIDPTDVDALVEAPVALARRAVRTWLTRDGYPPDAATVERVLAVARLDADGCDVGAGRSVRRRQGRLRIVDPSG